MAAVNLGTNPLPSTVDAAYSVRGRSLLSLARLLTVLCCWFVYLLAIPVLWIRLGNGVMLLMPTLGAYLYTWLAFYAHELLHGYFPGIHNPTWYSVISHLLLADPQVYRVAHARHHRDTHTATDMEIYYPGWHTSLATRRRQFVVEFLFGVVGWELSLRQLFIKEGRIDRRQSVQTAAIHAAILLTGCGLVSCLEVFSWPPFLANLFLSLWSGSVLIRHTQWLEHLGIIAVGTVAERRKYTRNLSTSTVFGKLASWFTHNESSNHLLHHSNPNRDTRNVDDVNLPEDANVITLSEYGALLCKHAYQLWTDDQENYRPELLV